MGATQSTSQPYVLKTSRGNLKGIEQKDKTGKSILQRYTRIPYALPPVGELRWRRPQPLPSSFHFSDADSPGDYSTFGPICPQPVYNQSAALVDNPTTAPPVANVEDEDCLYVNIWVPAGSPPPAGWPVQFDIHGGWLQVGDALQQNMHDPYDLLAHSTPRIIVSPTYRLNLFGFLAGADLAAAGADPAPGNYGLWDQRLALEWTHQNVSLFGGNASNITVGGLSAGAHSAFLQLYHDSLLSESKRIIKRCYFWSNAIAIQPRAADSAILTSQFNELCTANSISSTQPASAKLAALRNLPSATLIESISRLKMHTFRSSTDNDFIPSDFLQKIHSGALAARLAAHNTSIIIGEVADEAELYKLVNPPTTLDSLKVQLANYYPQHVIDVLLPLYNVPSEKEKDLGKKITDVFGQIVADCQVHASIRGITRCLSRPSSTSTSPSATKKVKLYRYRIDWRAKPLDNYLNPSVGVCHAADTPIWWLSGYRADYSQQDKQTIHEFLAPFGKFLNGDENIGWTSNETTTADDTQAEDRIRWLDAEGAVVVNEQDQSWDGAMRVWDAVCKAQNTTTS